MGSGEKLGDHVKGFWMPDAFREWEDRWKGPGETEMFWGITIGLGLELFLGSQYAGLVGPTVRWVEISCVSSTVLYLSI